MKYKPADYNTRGIRFIINTPRCNLWYDPGTGKTAMVLTALEALLLAGSNRFPVLILATQRVARRVWSDECKKWLHLNHIKVAKIVGTAKQRLEGLQQVLDGKVHAATINYENIQWLVNQIGKRKWPFRSVVCDEATKIKGFRLKRGGKRAAALAKIAKYTSRWINLTGTPSPKNFTDLWGQMWFIDQGKRLGRTFTAFTNRWFKHNEYSHKYEPLPHAEREISKLIADVTLSFKAKGLPKPIEREIVVDLPPRAERIYKSMEKEYFAELKKQVVDAANAADKQAKCLQIASGAIYTDKTRTKFEVLHNAKIEALQELVDELQGDPLLVVYHFQHDLARLKAAFPKGRVLKTIKDENDWNAGKIQVAFGHHDSMGHGLNLQDGGNKYCFFSHWWKLESFLQVLERMGAMRQKQAGHNRGCIVYYILAAGTVDFDVLERRRGNKTRMDRLRDRVVAERRKLKAAHALL